MPGAVTASPSLQIFLKLDGIDGESTDKEYPQHIEVLSYEHGLTQTIFRMGGGGMAAGQPRFANLRFRKPLDCASPPLLLACAAGRLFPSATFTFRRRAPARPALYTVTLGVVLVTGVTQTAGAGAHYPLSFPALDTGDDHAALLDEVALAYERIEWTYQIVDKTGNPTGPPIATGWDITGSRPI